jgi:hypothetical protein
MIKIYVIKNNGKIIAWSSQKMSDEEEEMEISEEDFQKLISTTDDEEIKSVL